MDSMGFGMGCCCLQLTFQACNVDEARRVYDALVPIGPILVNPFFFASLTVFVISLLLFAACAERR